MGRPAVALLVLLVASALTCQADEADVLAHNKAVVLRSEAKLWSKGNLVVAVTEATSLVCNPVRETAPGSLILAKLSVQARCHGAQSQHGMSSPEACDAGDRSCGRPDS